VDTGIGIPADKQQIIFEAFQQADGTTAANMAAPGWGFRSAEKLLRLLGGEIRVASIVGEEAPSHSICRDHTKLPRPSACKKRILERGRRPADFDLPFIIGKSYPTVEYNEVFEIADDRGSIEPVSDWY